MSGKRGFCMRGAILVVRERRRQFDRRESVRKLFFRVRVEVTDSIVNSLMNCGRRESRGIANTFHPHRLCGMNDVEITPKTSEIVLHETFASERSSPTDDTHARIYTNRANNAQVFLRSALLSQSLHVAPRRPPDVVCDGAVLHGSARVFS